MKYGLLMCIAALSSYNAEAMYEDDSSKVIANKSPLSLQTVMSPYGVTQEEWKEMFEETRLSIRKDIEFINKDINLVNAGYLACEQRLFSKIKEIYR